MVRRLSEATLNGSLRDAASTYRSPLHRRSDVAEEAIAASPNQIHLFAKAIEMVRSGTQTPYRLIDVLVEGTSSRRRRQRRWDLLDER